MWSGRISQELRAIIFKTGADWVLLHAGHHDDAYDWAERRRIDRHSVTGAVQIVDVQEVEVVESQVREADPSDIYSLIFGEYDDDLLLSLGVPESWLPAVRNLRFEEQLLEVLEKLPEEVAERLLTLSFGTIPTPPAPVAHDAPVQEAEGASRRFFVVDDDEALEAALNAPFDRWVAFLHPSQKALVAKEFSGPVKVSGGAGTGKTVVGLHRARWLAQNGQRVLLATHVTTLADNLRRLVDMLCPDPGTRSRIKVDTIASDALSIVRAVDAKVSPMNADTVEAKLRETLLTMPVGFSADFVVDEWNGVIEAQGIATWPEYRRARRTGRGEPLRREDRKALWDVFSAFRERAREDSRYSWGDVALEAARLVLEGEVDPEVDAVVVDELQDLSASQLRLLRALTLTNPGNLMLVGDAGQRIYPGGFSLSRLGIEVRGRSNILRLNYRTTEQIRQVADRLIGSFVDDLDGGVEDRRGIRSVRRGPNPEFQAFDAAEAEVAGLLETLDRWTGSGIDEDEIAVFVRTNDLATQLIAELEAAGRAATKVTRDFDPAVPGVRVGTMHRAKGLEFRAVAVVHATDGLLPLRAAVHGASDEHQRDEAIRLDRRLLYVAMTRARDELLVSWHGTPSRFLNDLEFNDD